MKKNLILGLLLTSILLMSVVGISAQITGEAVITGALTCASGGVGHPAGTVLTDSSGSYKCNGDTGRWDLIKKEIERDTDPLGGVGPAEASAGSVDRVGTTRTPSIRTGTPSASAGKPSRSLSPGRNWVKAYTANNEECWIKSAGSGRTSLFRGRFLGKLFE